MTEIILCGSGKTFDEANYSLELTIENATRELGVLDKEVDREYIASFYKWDKPKNAIMQVRGSTYDVLMYNIKNSDVPEGLKQHLTIIVTYEQTKKENPIMKSKRNPAPETDEISGIQFRFNDDMIYGSRKRYL